MGQILSLGQNKYLTVDRSFADGGKPVRYGLVGGQMVQLTDGQRPKPDILQIGKSFFYKNGEPVTKVEDVSYLEEPYKTLALEFINKGKPQNAPVVKTIEEASATKRGRGRPKKVEAPKGPRKIEIKDESSLRAIAGDTDVDSYEEN